MWIPWSTILMKFRWVVHVPWMWPTHLVLSFILRTGPSIRGANHIHGHSELAYEDLQNGDNLHENNLFLVVKFHSVHDCAAHLNRKSVVGRRELQNKVVVGYAYDCHSHCDLSSVVDYWKLVDVMPPQDDRQRWFQGGFVCHSPKASSQNPHAIKLVQVSDHLDLPSFWGI